MTDGDSMTINDQCVSVNDLRHLGRLLPRHSDGAMTVWYGCCRGGWKRFRSFFLGRLGGVHLEHRGDDDGLGWWWDSFVIAWVIKMGFSLYTFHSRTNACVKLWSSFLCQAPNTFVCGSNLGPILGPPFLGPPHFGSPPFWGLPHFGVSHFGSPPFWVPPPFWAPPPPILGPPHFGSPPILGPPILGPILGLFWVHFGCCLVMHFESLGVLSAFKQESAFRQESVFRRWHTYKRIWWHTYKRGPYTFTHNNITLEHTAMNDKNTIAHTDAYNTQFWAHCAPSVDAHVSTHRTCGSRLLRVCHPCHPCMRTCGWCLKLFVFLLVSFVFYLVSPFSFQPFLMSTSALNERSRSNPLCDSSLGSVGHIRLRHTPHRLWAQAGFELREHWRAEPRYHQRCLLPAHLGRHGFLPQRSRRPPQPVCGIPCSCGR